MSASSDSTLMTKRPGDLVGVDLACPRYDCGWTEHYGSAEVVNEYGVKDPVPRRCKKCGLPVEVANIYSLPFTPPSEES